MGARETDILKSRNIKVDGKAFISFIMPNMHTFYNEV